MEKVKLRKGDYVLTQGMDEETYHKVAQAFMEAGSAEGEYPNVSFMESNMEGWGFGWGVRGGMYHGLPGSYFTGRQLTIAKVLGEEPDMPAIGTCWEDPDDSEYAVEVVGYHNGEIICCDAKGGYSPYDPSELTVPAKSERDKAVEEMLDASRQGHCAFPTCKSMMENLYDAGYRKVEL